ncbi:hypothetical protein [Luteolibacter luteus]|uniref:PA14 domain-containing protein n=1 Tax=Luteolibacter luteus TaxID=2728835 RepID=A0A858RMQ4_9BACT|nr:hypothetical protein [Luteolibacter luteus]QJE97263.1 hypothetical protein HHL09_16190 [Luteolibacter luteus]
MNHPPNRDQGSFRATWRKLGGSSLSASLAFHVVLLIAAFFWVFRTIPEKQLQKKVDFMPTGGGGGDPALLERNMRTQHMNFATQRMARITAKDVDSLIPSSEPFEASPLKSPLQLDAITRSGGLGGEGVGGGLGDGRGKGFGSGTGVGKGFGSGARNPFGMIDPNQSALTGTFYNLNRSSDGSIKNTRYEDYHRLAVRFVNQGWNEELLSDYLKADTRLYLPYLYLPVLPATVAPRAFRQAVDPHPYWMLVYRGTVIAPKSGRFRFVGAGDDVLAVRFNKMNVFDHGYLEPTGTLSPGAPVMLAAPENQALYQIPKRALYTYPSTVDWNRNLGGMAAGPAFEVEEGHEYPIDILIAEGQGSLFAAALLIEEIGAEYPKSRTGAPVVPLFRTDYIFPAAPRGDNSPPYLLDSPVWKIVKSREKI